MSTSTNDPQCPSRPTGSDEADFSPLRRLLVLSGPTDEALAAKVGQMERHLRDHPEQSFADVCFSAAMGRDLSDVRLAVSAASRNEAVETLSKVAAGKRAVHAVKGTPADPTPPGVAFLFTGQGSQAAGMARSLYETQPVFRATLDRCARLLEGHLDIPLLSVLYPGEGKESPLHETAYTQPALFAVEFALADLWASWGVTPAWAMGHSVGEFVAACVAGVFSLEDGLKLIAARGRLMQALPPGGAMVAIAAGIDRIRPRLPDADDLVSVAAVNSPSQVVLSGDEVALDEILATLDEDGIRYTRLRVSHAFHSSRMEPMLEAFMDVCRTVTLSPPQLTLVSNVTGRVAGPELQTPEYWARHARHGVLFASGVQTVLEEGARVLLEVGPKPILTGLGQQCASDPDLVWLSTLRGKADDWTPVLKAASELFVRGVSIDVGRIAGSGRGRVPVPTDALPIDRHETDRSEKTGSPDQPDMTDDV